MEASSTWFTELPIRRHRRMKLPPATRVLPLLLTLVACHTPRAAGPAPGARALSPGERAAAARQERPRAPLPAAENDAVELLLEEGRFHYAEDGRRTYQYTQVYRVLRDDPGERWTMMAASYAPWHENTPVFEAEVKAADGRTHQLDPDAIVEQAAQNDTPGIIHDHRRMQAPLPAIARGSVVKRTQRIQEHRPFFYGGRYDRFFVGGAQPIERMRVIIDVPEDSPLRWAQRECELEMKERREDGRRTLIFEGRGLPRRRPLLHLQPPEMPDAPQLAWSTAASWQDVATRYSGLVDEAIEGESTAAAIADLVAGLDAGIPRLTLLAEMLARIRERIRYTGVELGEHSVIPFRPEETLERRFGDCKDQAALLVAMLRRIGVPAHVALLWAAVDDGDVPEDLPGIGGFDHAIVYVPDAGDGGLFIDPTSRTTPAGELPLPVQGRLALVASADTQTLQRTPASRSEDNVYVEEREIVMGAFGGARVSEVTRGKGAIAAALRAQFGDKSQLELSEDMTRYVRGAYRARRIETIEMTGGADTREDFELRFEADGARIAVTGEESQALRVAPGVLFNWMPRFLDRAVKKPDDGLLQARLTTRKADAVLPMPYQATLRYRVRPPPGYRISRLPEPRRLAVGEGELRIEIREAADRFVIAEVHFDTGPRRHSAEQLLALVRGLQGYGREEQLALEFQHQGQQLIAAGKVREGLEVYRSLSAADPHEPLYQRDLAMVLLELGLGEPARRAAQRAVRLDPRSPGALEGLAWVLQHDLFGRHLATGFDLEEADLTYKDAEIVDPDNCVIRAQHAVLLEHDPRGKRWSTGARLDDAQALYESVREDDSCAKAIRDQVETNLLALHLSRGDWDAVGEVLGDGPYDAKRASIAVVRIAAVEGAEAALTQLEQWDLDAGERLAVLDSAGASLARVRRYELAALFADAAARRAGDSGPRQQRVALFKRLAERKDQHAAADAPEVVIERVLTALFSGEPLEVLTASASPALAESPELKDLGEALERMRLFLHREAEASGIALQMFEDIARALVRIGKDGSPELGFRLRMSLVGPGLSGSDSYFVLREGDTWQLRGTMATPAALGREILSRLDAQDALGARTWMRWVHEAVGESRRSGRGGELHPLLAWRALFTDEADETLRIAASILVAQAKDAPGDAALARLQAAREARDDPREQRALDRALLYALRARAAYAEMSEVAARLSAADPGASEAFALQGQGLLELGRFAEVTALAKSRLENRPGDADALQLLGTAALLGGDYAGAEAAHRKSIELGVADAWTYNNLAWLGLFHGDLDEEDVSLALQANQMTSFEAGSAIHTLATIYAELGRGKEAFKLVLRRMEREGRAEPDGADWYVLGRIMESFGLAEDARVAYTRVDRDARSDHGSSWALAQDRLRAMGGEGG